MKYVTFPWNALMLAKKEQLYLNAMLHKHKSEFGNENKKKTAGWYW